MELRQLWPIIWKWLWLILLAMVLSATGAYITSQYATPVYRATTTLLINEPTTVTAEAERSTILPGERLVRSYAERLTNRHVLQQVIDDTGLAMGSEDLEKLIDVQLVRDTQLIELSVEHTNPATAMLIANQIPEAFSARNAAQQGSRFAASKASLEAELADIEAEIGVLEVQLAPYNGLEGAERPTALDQRMAELQVAHGSLLSTYEEIRFAEALALDSVVIEEEASLPAEPVRPRVALSGIVAGTVSAVLAIGAVLLIEYLDDTLKDPTEVSQVLKVPVLALIPHLRHVGDEPLIVVEESRSLGVEAFRALRTNIQYVSVDRPVRSILVASLREGDGKTLIAANLAGVIAQAGEDVILVDSDLRHPDLSRVFRLGDREGLSDALFLPGFEQLITWSSPLKSLRLLPSGGIPPNPSELLGSERMGAMISFMAEYVDFVIFDSPAMLAVTGAALLAKQVDGVVLVLEAGRARRAEALRVLEDLREGGANVLGVVLNKVRSKGRGYYYHYFHSEEPLSDDEQRIPVTERELPDLANVP